MLDNGPRRRESPRDLVEIARENDNINVGVRSSDALGEQVERPASGYPVGAWIGMEKRSYCRQGCGSVD
jgi:hypothetical protein